MHHPPREVSVPTLTDKSERAIETLDWFLRLTTQAAEHPAPLHWIRDQLIDMRAAIVKDHE